MDLRFSSGVEGKGTLFLIYEPTTGLYDRNFGWDAKTYPEVFDASALSSHWLVGVADGKMITVTFPNPYLFVSESAERVASLDDAERIALRYVTDHLSEVEARSEQPHFTSIDLDGPTFPAEFISREPFSPIRKLPLTFISMARRDHKWVLTFENNKTHERAVAPLGKLGPLWGCGQPRSKEEKNRSGQQELGPADR